MAASNSDVAISLSNLHSDIIKTHILPKLDGPSLLAVGSSSSDLRSLCSDNELWKDICRSTWGPSLNDPRVSEAISTFPSGHRSFYQDSFPILQHPNNNIRPGQASSTRDSQSKISELISAIDIRYQDKLVYSKVQVTETQSDAFLSNPLWVELVEPNPTVLPGFSRVNFDESEAEFLAQVEENVTLNWVMIDPTHKRAGNFSSVRPIFARANWMTNEVHMRFVTILPAADPKEFVQCRIEVTCEGKEGGELHVREVSMHVHDMDSKCLTGEESLVIFHMAMEGGRRKLGKRGEEKVNYEEFLQKRRERRERRVRRERRKANINRILQLSTFVASLVCVSEFLFC